MDILQIVCIWLQHRYSVAESGSSSKRDLDFVATVATFAVMKVGVREAKNNLSEFGDLAHRGERIVVSKNGKPWFDMVPHEKGNRNVKPLKGVKATVSAEEALAPVAGEDIEGWN